MNMFKKYIINIAYGLDVLVHAIFWPGGKMGQTISGRLGSSYPGSIAERFVDWLMEDDDGDNCEDAAEKEINLK